MLRGQGGGKKHEEVEIVSGEGVKGLDWKEREMNNYRGIIPTARPRKGRGGSIIN